jgi:hypothetical protein
VQRVGRHGVRRVGEPVVLDHHVGERVRAVAATDLHEVRVDVVRCDGPAQDDPRAAAQLHHALADLQPVEHDVDRRFDHGDDAGDRDTPQLDASRRDVGATGQTDRRSRCRPDDGPRPGRTHGAGVGIAQVLVVVGAAAHDDLLAGPGQEDGLLDRPARGRCGAGGAATADRDVERRCRRDGRDVRGHDDDRPEGDQRRPDEAGTTGSRLVHGGCSSVDGTPGRRRHHFVKVTGRRPGVVFGPNTREHVCALVGRERSVPDTHTQDHRPM